jgi:hypothetical protein
MIRLGAPVYGACERADEWVATVKREGWSAAYCPPVDGKDPAQVRVYADAARKAGIVMAVLSTGGMKKVGPSGIGDPLCTFPAWTASMYPYQQMQ